jgi:hypothetical protein
MPVPKTILQSDEHAQHIWQKVHDNVIEMKSMEKERVRNEEVQPGCTERV